MRMSPLARYASWSDRRDMESIAKNDSYSDGSREAVKWFQGRSGKVSSKRIAGLVLVATGVAVSFLSVFLQYPDPEKILWPVLSAGTLLLGAGVLERFGSTNKKEGSSQ